jgi:hypothetical protein
MAITKVRSLSSAYAEEAASHTTHSSVVFCRVSYVRIQTLEHDPEKACPGLDPGWEPVIGKDHAQTKS